MFQPLRTRLAAVVLPISRFGGYASDFGGGGDGAGFMALLMLGLALTLVLFWLLVKGAWTVVKAMGQESEGKTPFWVCFGLWVVSVFGVLAAASAGTGAGGMAATQGSVLGVAGGVCGLFSLFLYLAARQLNAENQQLFARPKEKLASAVLRHSWWPPLNELS